MYTAGLNVQDATGLCDMMKMSRGVLPVKCLDLPLISSKLSYKDCQPIFNKLEQKIKGRANKKLSYGGRLQLIQTVLSKIYLHWYSVFILPKTLVKKVNSLLASFLRPGETKQMYGAKVR